MNACEAGYRVKFYIAAELAEAVQMNRLARLKKPQQDRFADNRRTELSDLQLLPVGDAFSDNIRTFRKGQGDHKHKSGILKMDLAF